MSDEQDPHSVSAAPRVPASGQRVGVAGTTIPRAGHVDRGDALMEQRLGGILRLGVRASTVFLAVGLLLSVATGYDSAGTSLMTIGLMMLMATPVARVAVSAVEYAVWRDWMFFIITSIVLLELCAGIVAALVFHRRL